MSKADAEIVRHAACEPLDRTQIITAEVQNLIFHTPSLFFLACSAKLPTGLYILLALISFFFFF